MNSSLPGFAKIGCSAVIAVVLVSSLAGCGVLLGSGGGKKSRSDKNPPGSQSELSYVVDSKALQATDNKIQQVTGAVPQWTVRASQSGKELAKVENGTITDVIGALSKLSFKPKDVALFELTIAAKGEENRILATNVKDQAQKSEMAQKIWALDCEGKIKPDVNFSEVLKPSSYEGKGQISVQLAVCDIEGAIAQPGVAIIAQPKFYEVRTASFICERETNHDLDFLYSSYSKDCVPGYISLPNETPREFHVPKGLDLTPTSPMQFNVSHVSFVSDSGYVSVPSYLNYVTPFSMTCNRIRLDSFKTVPVPGAADTLVLAPLAFSKKDGKWQQEGPKTSSSEENNYRRANKDQKRTLIFECEWVNDQKDGAVLINQTRQ